VAVTIVTGVVKVMGPNPEACTKVGDETALT
jgi:hypothetical protein